MAGVGSTILINLGGNEIKRIIILLVVCLLLLAAASFSSTGRADTCLQEAEDFAVDCYQQTGDAAACTHAAYLYLRACRGQ